MQPTDSAAASVVEFAARFPDDEACARHLAALRWPEGYRCAACGHDRAYAHHARPRVYECSACGKQESVTAGTVMHRSHLSLVEWFWAAWYLAQDKRGVSAMLLSKLLDRRYETAWRLLHKIRAALEEDASAFPLEGVVEVDEVYLGGPSTKDKGGRSLADPRRSLVVAAVERVDTEAPSPGVRGTGTRFGDARLDVVDSASAADLLGFLERACARGTIVVSDGWSGYARVGSRGWVHAPEVEGTPERGSEILPLVHTMFSNLRSWLAGTFHGVSPKWLRRYLAEFQYRLNRRWREPRMWEYVVRRLERRPWIPEARLHDGLATVAAAA